MTQTAQLIDISVGRDIVKDPMSDWYKTSWVRRQAVKNEIPDTVNGQVLFSPHLVPPIKHPLIIERGEEFTKLLLAQRFFVYANFTSWLEREAVNVVAARIARKQIWCELPASTYLGAGRIYTDEAFHAQEADELLQALATIIGIEPRYLMKPTFLVKLETLLTRLDSRQREIAMIAFAIVSETLITSILVDIPTDPLVIASVKDFVRQHAIDEGKHHAYFGNLLKVAWPQLPLADREFLGPLMAQFVRWFLDPDLGWLRSFLGDQGFADESIGAIIHDSYPRVEVEAGIRHSARHSITKFEEVGMLESERAADAFKAAGLIVSETVPPHSQGIEE